MFFLIMHACNRAFGDSMHSKSRLISSFFIALLAVSANAQQAVAPGPTPTQQQTVAPAKPAPPPANNLAIKYMRDSEEYATLARQVYRAAGTIIADKTRSFGKGSWSVSIDIDETALDNSAYQLELVAYGQEHNTQAFNAWVARREARAVPGAAEFVNLVRKLGGNVAWISDRDASTAEATRQNLAAVGLWSDDDRLCLKEIGGKPKSARRQEVVSGTGKCSWNGSKHRMIAFVGDQLGDFPSAEEQIPETGSDSAFGSTCFLLPNPTYGRWTNAVTRIFEQEH
jgi:5'-nucleotidase (lipoprotein e(P4) family)